MTLPAPPPNPAPTQGPRPVPPPEVVRAGWLTLGMGAASPVLAVLLFPLGFALGLGAALAGRRTVRAAHGQGVSAPGTAAAGITLGAVGMALAVLVGAVLWWLWPQVTAYRDCLQGANTQLARSACEDQLIDDLRARWS